MVIMHNMIITLPGIHDFVQQVARYDSLNSDMKINTVTGFHKLLEGLVKYRLL